MKNTAKNVGAVVLMIAAAPFLVIGLGLMFAVLALEPRSPNGLDRLIDRIIDGRVKPA